MTLMTSRTASLVALIAALTVPCYFISSRRSDPRITRNGKEDFGVEGNLPKRGGNKKAVLHDHLKPDDGATVADEAPEDVIAAPVDASLAKADGGDASLAEINSKPEESSGDAEADSESMDAEGGEDGEDADTEDESLVEEEADVTAEDTEKWRPTFNYLAKGRQNIKLDDYVKWQVGSLSSLVQSKVRAEAEKFAHDGILDLHAFAEMKKADEQNEHAVNEAMFQSFDSDNDGRVAVDDLVQWTKEDAAAHGVTLTPDQEKMFKDQYLHYSEGEETMDLHAFTLTGLAKVIVQSKMAPAPNPQ